MTEEQLKNDGIAELGESSDFSSIAQVQCTAQRSPSTAQQICLPGKY